MEFNLHIERVVLDGVDVASGQGDLLGASVRDELARLFDRGGLGLNFDRGASLNRVAADSIRVSSEEPQALGRQIAQSVYGGIGLE